MVVVGELLLAALLPVLFERLASGDFLNFVRELGGGVDSGLKKWVKKLKMIQAVLRDAEEKQLTDEAVKLWLDDLQDLAYDAEDILDEFATEALKRKLMAENPDQPTASSSRVRNIFPVACFNCLSPSTIEFNSSMRSKVKDITRRLEELLQQKNELGLQLTPEGTSSTYAAQRRPPSSSVPTERAVYGRDDDKAKILKMVSSHGLSDANFEVIPIVGMGGVGKTTLAREVLNDEAIKDFKFDIKAWVCVSDVFDVLSISKALLESITGNPCHLNTLNEVQVKLKMAVNGKKFLLVLDDVWNEDYSSWEVLRAPFLAAAANSKMIVTTRHSHVASTMGPIKHHNLNLLKDDDCWSIFLKHSFESRDLNTHQLSDSFRKRVVGKCRGLPLAAKTLGGLLRTNSYNVWEDLLDSKIWDLPQQSGILPVLRLSYHHLPSHLKRCFSYCAIFPKDYKFNEKELVFLWIAGGIIRQARNKEQLEDWGSKCFHDLVSRSIFQKSNSDSSEYEMHDLVHDLAEWVSGESICRSEEANTITRRLQRVRHSSYARGWCDGKSKFEVFYEIEHLRTFLPLHIRGGYKDGYITSMVLTDLLPKFKKLRVLSLQGYRIGDLPIPFEDLRLLTYLNLTATDIRSLPESICSLLNLEILILRNCSRLIKLPSKMKNLVNLCHLDIRGAILLEEMPFGMKELKNLQTLSNFIVSKGETASGLEDLKNLKFLSGELCISGLQNVNVSKNAREAALCQKQNLEALSLEWGSQFDSSRDVVVEEQVLDVLQPQKRIKELTIKNYGGARFPLWIGDPLFSKMEVLKLENCENCISLPALGLLSSLKHLAVTGLKKLKSIGSEVYGEGFSMPFQSLEILSFENFPEWEYWEHIEIFPRLHKLSIVECPKLSGKVPELMPSLKTFVVSKCQKLIVSLSSYPMLCRLKVDECKELVCRAPIDSKLIESMTISNSSLDIKGCEGMLHNSPTDFSLFKTVTISNVLEFGKLIKPGFQIFKKLGMGNSERIKSWREYGINGGKQGLTMLAYLEEVSIEENCISLVSFPELNVFLTNLRVFRIEKCTAFKSLPEKMMGSNSQLERLHIEDCDSLTFIARSGLPSSLISIYIENCKNLQHLVDGEEYASSSSSLPSSMMLKYLDIRNCPELTNLSSGIQLLEALEALKIMDCPKLESIPDGLHNLKCLQDIVIWDCPSLVSFPERGLPNTVSWISIRRCEKLEALPKDINKLKSLQYLGIEKCPSIVSYPEEGFPMNLTSLEIVVDVEMYKAVIRWGLHRFTSLTSLFIKACDEAEYFPDEGMAMMMPTSLTKLMLLDFPKLKYLSSRGFQSLTSLEYLSIHNCPNLTSFPEAGLPSSLLMLWITDCPKIKKECKRDKGKEWSKIAHIPSVHIEKKFIHDPDSEEESENV